MLKIYTEAQHSAPGTAVSAKWKCIRCSSVLKKSNYTLEFWNFDQIVLRLTHSCSRYSFSLGKRSFRNTFMKMLANVGGKMFGTNTLSPLWTFWENNTVDYNHSNHYYHKNFFYVLLWLDNQEREHCLLTFSNSNFGPFSIKSIKFNISSCTSNSSCSWRHPNPKSRKFLNANRRCSCQNGPSVEKIPNLTNDPFWFYWRFTIGLKI